MRLDYKYKQMTAVVLATIAVFISITKNSKETYALTKNVLPDVFKYEKVVAITFDDGPRKDTTAKLLDGLKERNVRATFFVIGKNVSGNEEIIKRMSDEGHLIGNHTFNHVQLTAIPENSAINEIDSTNQVIKNITGECPRYMRPPYGFITKKVEEEFEMECVLWSVDPCDWECKDCNIIVKKVVNNIKSGDIILMHDIYESSVVAALEIIDQLKEKGYVFVTVDQILLD